MCKILKYIFPLIIFVSLFSCSTDVDLIQEWQDIPVVYAILDVNKQTQYIRIIELF